MRGTHMRLEALELRALFSTFHVTTGDDGVAGSLRDAIAQANANPGADVIILQTPTVTLNSTGAAQDADQSADLDVTDDLRIVGTGSGGTTIDAQQLDRVF